MLSLGMLAGMAHAQPAWTFDRILQSTLLSHPALRGKRSEQVAAQADQDGAEWQRYPAVSVESAAQTRNGSASLIRIEQALWTGGRITAGINAAGSKVEAAGAALEEERLNLSLRVVAAYTEAMRQKARQQYVMVGVAEHEKLLNMIRRRVEQDVSSLTDQRLAESRMYQANNDQSAVTQALNNSLAQLTQLTGKVVADISVLKISDLDAPAGLEVIQSLALSYSPMLQRLTHQEAVANADVIVRRSAYMPQLVLRLERQTGQTSDSRAMLVLLAQPGSGLSAMSGVDAALAKSEAVRMTREAAERDLHERITLDWNEWVAARQRLENASQSRIMSTEVFESYTRQYVIGRKTWSDVLNAVREATQSQFAQEDARAQTIAASLRLSAQSGSLKQFERPRP